MLSTWPQGPLISSEEVCILGKGEISPGGGGGGGNAPGYSDKKNLHL